MFVLNYVVVKLQAVAFQVLLRNGLFPSCILRNFQNFLRQLFFKTFVPVIFFVSASAIANLGKLNIVLYFSE